MARRGITRRDFLNGTRIAITGAALAPLGAAVLADGGCAHLSEGPYPPALTGMRGSQKGSYEVAHSLVAGRRFDLTGRDVGERYDLVVVGGGISGLSAAWFYRQRVPGARILIVENHDDFGGHARRNEFEAGGRLRISYGGTQSIDTPSGYSAVAMGLLRELGIELEKFRKAFDRRLYPSLGLSVGYFFDAVTFGSDRLIAGYGSLPWRDFAERAPLGARARDDLVRLHTEKRDYLPGLTAEQKSALLQRISYADFLRDHARVDPQVVAMYRRFWITYFAVDAESNPALEVARDPGFLPGLAGTYVETPAHEDPYIFHFPDGNASIARLLVRSLIPAAIPGHDMEDIVTARADYTRLDLPGAPVRLRLDSTVVGVEQVDGGRSVRVGYVRAGRVETVLARHCVLACYNRAIPYLCPELPERQKRGLAHGVRAPLVYVSALVRDWRAFVELGVHQIHAPESFYTWLNLDFPVSLGDYRNTRSPDQPIVVHLEQLVYDPKAEKFDQWRGGRREMLTTPFSVYEERLRDQLDRILGPGGFDADAELMAITVNRWAHGYAYEPNSLWDPPWRSEDEKPWVIGRQPHGRIAIANSDAGARAYTDAAIDQAYRAVGDLFRDASRGGP